MKTRNREPLDGKEYDRITVIGFSHRVRVKNGTVLYYHCKCSCGGATVSPAGNIRMGRVTSCGCARVETLKAMNTTHGRTGTAEYGSWKSMRDRCNDPSDANYHRYGGRGITICERWDDFANFFEDMGERPGPGYSIEREDNDGNYEPDNCRWATAKEQARNRSTNRLLTWRGETRTMAEWGDVVGIRQLCIASRLARGWTVHDALTKPVRLMGRRQSA